MRIEADAVVPFPRDRVFAANRDDMARIADLLPNVRRIDVALREEAPGVVRLRNVWHGGGEIPASLRAVVSESMLSWTDHATWIAGDHCCEWRIETHAFTEAVRCAGTTRFVDLGQDRTRMEIRGDLSIHLDRVRGVPSFLAGSLAGNFERFLVRQITPNLTSMADALTRYLERERG
jgi:hypothetical protein